MKNNKLFSLLQGLFYLGTVILSILLMVIIFLGLEINQKLLKSITQNKNLKITNVEMLKHLSISKSPMLILSIILIIIIMILISVISSKIFKALTNGEIFLKKNTTRLKEVSILVGILSFIFPLPALILSTITLTDITYTFDIGSLIMCMIIFSFAKIWEQANEIAEENKFTI